MAGIEIGTICIKTTGRTAGKKVVVLDIDEKSNFALIDGLHFKRKKVNLLHLFPTGKKIEVRKNEVHEEVVKLLKE